MTVRGYSRSLMAAIRTDSRWGTGPCWWQRAQRMDLTMR